MVNEAKVVARLRAHLQRTGVQSMGAVLNPKCKTSFVKLEHSKLARKVGSLVGRGKTLGSLTALSARHPSMLHVQGHLIQAVGTPKQRSPHAKKTKRHRVGADDYSAFDHDHDDIFDDDWWLDVTSLESTRLYPPAM